MSAWGAPPSNTGDDLTGTVHAVGSDVTEFSLGDRVAAFHAMGAPGGAYAEYAVAPQHMVFRLPGNVGWEEGATVPLTCMTAAVGLFSVLGLGMPWSLLREGERTGPLVIYGAAGAVGAFATQLASHAGVHPLICVAGRGREFVEGLIDSSLGDVVVDYRAGDVPGAIRAAAGGEEILYAFDAVAGKGSVENCCAVLSRGGGRLAAVLPVDPGVVPEGVVASQMEVGAAFKGEGGREMGFVFSRWFGLGLAEGWLKPHPHQVVPGGLGGVERALKDLQAGKASAVKYVFRIEETEGVGKG